MKVSRPAVFGHPPSAPSQSAEIFTVGGGAPKPGAPPKKRLQVLPTARWRALDLWSVNTGAGSLFFAFQKKFESAPAPQLAIAPQHTRRSVLWDLHFAYWASRRLVREPVISGV